MAALRDGDGRREARSSRPAGAYLTDGVFLYRVASLVTIGIAQLVELEDCYLLDVVCVPVGEVRARRLRVVIPSPD